MRGSRKKGVRSTLNVSVVAGGGGSGSTGGGC